MVCPDYTKLRGPQFTEKHFRFHYPEFLEYINKKYQHLNNFQERLYWEANGLTKAPTCYCGNPVVFEGFTKGYRKYCSRKCMNTDPDKKAAVRATNMERYGGPAPCSSKDIQNKMENTLMDRYGHKNALQIPSIKERVFGTIAKRYGGILGASPILMERAKQTMLKRYGVEYSHQCPEIMAKAIATNMERYGVSNPCLLNPATAAPSAQEFIIRTWLDDWGITYTTNDRTIITPKELDIYIPALNIAIECNGCYWHSDVEKPKDYHIKKFQECAKKGIQLIQVWEDWMINKPEIVRSFLQAKLGICYKTYFARKCEVREIDYQTANIFLEENHIQGKCSSNYRLGLYFNGQLVSVMCFNKRSAVSGPKVLNDSEAELIRFCNLIGTRVIGGAGKLLRHYIRKFHPSLITSYSANDISNGRLYQSLGFVTDGKISESYWYIEPGTFKRQHRSIYTRSGIVRKWSEYDINDKTWTERMVMDSKGYMRIYDSGTTKWSLPINYFD